METPEQYTLWGLDEPGVFICADFSGKRKEPEIFYSKDMFEEEGFGPMTVDEEAEIHKMYAKFCMDKPEVTGLPYIFQHLGLNSVVEWVLILFEATGGKATRYAKYKGAAEFAPFSHGLI